MSMTGDAASAPAPSVESPTHINDTDSAMDTEMTCPLTLPDDRKSRSHSHLSPPITEDMTFNSSRERSERINSNQPQTGPRNAFNSGPLSTWRRELNAAPTGQNFPSSSYPPPQYQSSQYPPSQYDPRAPTLGSHVPPHRDNSVTMGNNSIPLSSVYPGAAWPTEDQLDVAYAYGVRREDGSITRLLRADEPRNPNIPQHQGPEGLIILPLPRQCSPSRRGGGEAMISSEVVQRLPGMNRLPQHPGLPMRPISYDETQQHIDAIVTQSAVSTPPGPIRRREKIYCDKWIHEGVCAFTQMGCKYKHEMPMDKATQLSLGLNHGIPNWYRRAYAVNLTLTSLPPALTSPPSNSNGNRDGRPTNAPWRMLPAPPSNKAGATVGGMQTSARGYGPIAPPLSQTFSNNPYSSLKVEEEGDDGDEDETITYCGRPSRPS